MERVDFWHEIENKFWLVARAKNPLCATYAHESKEAAFEEAERLAKKENDRFLVLECVGYCETNSIRVVRFDTHKDVSHDAPDRCNWVEDKEERNFWHTDCGSTVYYALGFWRDKDPEYCCFCGKKFAFVVNEK